MSVITPLDIYLPEVKVFFLNLDSYFFSSLVLCIFNFIFIQPLLPFHKSVLYFPISATKDFPQTLTHKLYCFNAMFKYTV